MLDGFTRHDFENAIAVAGLDCLAVEAVGKLWLQVPLRNSLSRVLGCSRCWSRGVGGDGGAIGGLHIDGLPVDTGQFKADGVILLSLDDFGMERALR